MGLLQCSLSQLLGKNKTSLKTTSLYVQFHYGIKYENVCIKMNIICPYNNNTLFFQVVI